MYICTYIDMHNHLDDASLHPALGRVLVEARKQLHIFNIYILDTYMDRYIYRYMHIYIDSTFLVKLDGWMDMCASTLKTPASILRLAAFSLKRASSSTDVIYIYYRYIYG